ncbi:MULTISPECIES: hypothetical protein [Limosilactobacillus]|uniref:hypothetical protein n=1 Tax=Limosilactobacillus TaxID=2742598 RepID=UPI0022E904E4|nr:MULTISPECIES: hypothetical protein [Limosilactobacillus]MDM8332043.1 hypothetical protein [Limosilactobacillus pontis]
MLERYYKSKQDFEEFLDKTYDPASFLKFIESFVSLPYEVKTRANNFRYEDITNNSSIYKTHSLNKLNSETVFVKEGSFLFVEII